MDIVYGGSAIGIANSILTGALALTAAAMFCSMAILLVRQFLSTNQDMIQYGTMYKKVCGIVAIMFIICALARCGTGIATTFKNIPSPLPNTNYDQLLDTTTGVYLTNGSSVTEFKNLSGGGWNSVQRNLSQELQDAGFDSENGLVVSTDARDTNGDGEADAKAVTPVLNFDGSVVHTKAKGNDE